MCLDVAVSERRASGPIRTSSGGRNATCVAPPAAAEAKEHARVAATGECEQHPEDEMCQVKHFR
jgi:hypothetical protein